MPASRNSKSDEDKIGSALQANRKFVTKGATVLDYPTSPGGEFRVLRVGTNEKMLQTFNQDGSTGEPYANHLDGPTPSYFW
jgi:hypothetical protein